jgi:antitoxin ParD1/3/4
MPQRATRTVSFTPEQEAFVTACVGSGRYQSASEVVRAGLRLLQDQEAFREAELQRVRALIQTGADQLDRGEVVEGDEVFRRWDPVSSVPNLQSPRNTVAGWPAPGRGDRGS